ncbi:MAG: hypothetical protein BroJett040_00120 [Oligoflexia bacterium]|nr:MAG: hypothetical protein BroJett040_00120 [Oligoflexia bacterium]
MRIENIKFVLRPYKTLTKGPFTVIQGGSKDIELTHQQYQYFDHLSHGTSIEQMVDIFLRQGWLVCFRDLYSVIEKLTQVGLIQNPEVIKYISEVNHQDENPSFWSKLTENFENQKQRAPTAQDLSELPFFRSLSPDLKNLFTKNCEIFDVPAQFRLCKSEDQSRDLFVLLKGEASVYKVYPDGRRQLISQIPEGSVVGEGGFLLGKPRSADIITTTPATLGRIRFNDQVFGPLIKSDKASALQQRFWVVHGLLNSDLFQQVPNETLDALIFVGQLKAVKENEIVCREGDPGRSFFVIIQGSLVFSQAGKTLRVLSQGGLFGEIALMVSGGVRTATAIAQRDSLLLEVQMPAFYKILGQHLFLAKELETIAQERYLNRVK